MISVYSTNGRWPIHCSTTPSVVERVADQREVFLRVDEAGAGVSGLDDVGGDDVEAPIGQRQEIAPVVDADVDVGPVEQVVVDVRENGAALRTLSDSSTTCTRAPGTG